MGCGGTDKETVIDQDQMSIRYGGAKAITQQSASTQGQQSDKTAKIWG